jgi:hypothetical protein
MFEVVFDYGGNHLLQLQADAEGRQFVESTIEEHRPWSVRQDPISSYRAAFEIRTYRLCRRVLMFYHFPDELRTADYLVRARLTSDIQRKSDQHGADDRGPIGLSAPKQRPVSRAVDAGGRI